MFQKDILVLEAFILESKKISFKKIIKLTLFSVGFSLGDLLVAVNNRLLFMNNKLWISGNFRMGTKS